MPRKTSSTPHASEWNRQKKVILSLLAQHPWSVVIDKMEKEHNFSASSEQYVTQMRVWNIRKNLKQPEWRSVLHRLDRLVARHQRKIRVRLLGKVVSEEKIKRSRDRYCVQSYSNIPGTDLAHSIPTHVSFEVLGADDEWSTCTNDTYNSETPQQMTNARPAEFSSQSMQLVGVENLDEDASTSVRTTYIEQQLHLPGPLSANEFDGLDLALPTSFLSEGQETNWLVKDFMSDSTFDFGLDVEQPTSFDFLNTITQKGTCNFNQHTSLTTRDLSIDLLGNFANFLTFDPSSLNDLPFQQFQNSMANMGIDLNSFVSQMTKARSYKASSLVTKFLRDVTETRSSLSNIPGPQESPRNIQPSSPLLSFHSLLPGEPKECQTGLITNDVMLDAKFIRLLLFSITNGLAGLGDIPFASILRSLNKYENIEPLFMTVLRASPNHVAKSLAENLVKVAIEAQDSHIVKYLLDSQLLNINDLVCEAKGQKLTAVERAAQLRDCKTVEVLLAKHADVHKSYASIAKECGPLNLLINGFLRGETIPPDTLDLCNALFRRGAKVDVTMLERVLKESRNSDIALWLVSRFLETHETDLVRDGILPRIAGEMEEEEAYEAIKQILSACGRRHNGGCLQNLEGKVEMALVQSAKRGHVRTVQLLLPHTSDLHRVLSASFHSGQSEIVNLILAERPDFNTPAHRIDEEHWTEGHENLVWTVTTPLAEALRTRNAQWIQLCEDAGTLQHLHLTGNFGAALAAAATIGDLRYVQKLFNHRPEPLPEEMHVALVFSIENGHDDMSSLLIDAGAALYHPSNINSRQPPPLFAAVRQQNARVVRKILDAGTEYMYIMHSFYAYELLRDSTIMIELINWGDRTIISDFCYAFPAETTERVQVLKLRKGVMTKNLLDFLMDQGCLHERTLSRLLEVAIEENDTAMVDHLLKLGADPSKDHILCVAAKKMSRPDILDALLDHIPRRSRRVPGLGTLAIRTAIELGLSGLRMVDILIASEVVDIHGHVEVPPATTESPLGTAITMVDDFTSDFVVVKRLLKAGCDPNRVVIAELSYNLTALLAAVKTHNVDLVQVLLDHGAKVNTEATNRRLRTPLQAAAESGCLEVVQLLLKNNADVNALPAPRRGGTAFQLAATSGNCNIAAELLKHGADALMKPSFVQGRWPLEGAAENGRLDMISFLLRLNVYDADQCKRAVRFAEDNGHMGCKDLLLEHILQWESMSHFAASDVGRGLDLLA